MPSMESGTINRKPSRFYDLCFEMINSGEMTVEDAEAEMEQAVWMPDDAAELLAGWILDKRSETPEQIRLRLIREANERHADLPQYEGHWDGWTLGRLRKDIQWHGYAGPENCSGHAGDFVLVDVPRPGMMSYLAGGSFTHRVHLPNSVVGSGRGLDTAIYKSDVEVLG